MSRKIFLLLALLLAFLLAFSFTRYASSASTSGQGTNPVDKDRPDQYSYHGFEDILFFQQEIPPAVASIPSSAPVEWWSMVTFESYVNDNWEIFVGNGGFGNLTRLTNNGASDIHPRLNRGCTQIAFASNWSGSYEIFTMNVDGTHVVRLTDNAYDDVKPAWSPDGTRIAFQSYRDGNAEVYLMNADGSGQTNLTNDPDYDGEPSWSPDGSKIAFTSRRTLQYRIYAMDANGANPVMLNAQRYSENPAWSPDGSMIVYDADDDASGFQSVWTMNADGSLQTLRVSHMLTWTFWANGWSPDSEYYTYTFVRLYYHNGTWYWVDAQLWKGSIRHSGSRINPSRDYDWEVDWTTSDNQPPTTAINHLFSPLPYRFLVSWPGQDDHSGIKSYEVQVRDGAAGAWTEWQNWTDATSAIFTGVGGHEYFFRARAQDNAFNLQPWPVNSQASSTVETYPPYTRVNALAPLTRGNSVRVAWGGVDPDSSGIKTYDIETMRDLSGTWQPWLTNSITTTAVFSGELGHTYSFRSRGMDNALNLGEWSSTEGDTGTGFYSWRTIGTVSDNTGVPVSGADTLLNPTAFLSIPSDRYGRFSAYLGENPPSKTVIWSKDGYTALPPTGFGAMDTYIDVTLPPLDNQVRDWGFERGSLPEDWMINGDFTPTLTNTLPHSGNYATVLGTYSGFSRPITIGPINSGSTPVMAIDDTGTIHFVWLSYENPLIVNYVNRQPDGTWSSVQIISELSQFSPINIAVDHNMIVHVCWTDNINVYHSWRAVGGAWSAPNIVMTSPIGSPRIMLMSTDQSNSVHLLIVNNYDIGYHVYNSSNDLWIVEEIPSTHDWCNEADWVLDQTGDLYLVWSGILGGLNYIYRDSLSGWSNEMLISPYYAANPDIKIDSTNHPHVIWIKELQKLQYSRLDESHSWSTPTDLSDGMYNWDHPYLFITNQDEIYILFGHQISDFYTREVSYIEKKYNQDWSLPVTISSPREVGLSLSAVQNSTGDIEVIWTNFGGRLYYARLKDSRWSSIINSPGSAYGIYAEVDKFDNMNVAYYVDEGLYTNIIFMQRQSLIQSGVSNISQSLTIPITMTHPTLSFLASLSGVSDLSQNDFFVQVSHENVTTNIFTSTIPTGWQHFWFDITPWSGQAITLTFQLTEHAGYPPARALLDEVTLGAAHADVWVELSGGPSIAAPGDTFTYQLDYGNHGGIPASGAVITMTLPLGFNVIDVTLPPVIVGDQLVWQLGELPSGTSPDPILITVQVGDNAPLMQSVTTNVEITTQSPELEQLNNSSQSETYLGYRRFLPLIQN